MRLAVQMVKPSLASVSLKTPNVFKFEEESGQIVVVTPAKTVKSFHSQAMMLQQGEKKIWGWKGGQSLCQACKALICFQDRSSVAGIITAAYLLGCRLETWLEMHTHTHLL